MVYVNLVIVVASAVLAILSRKHYSKYKGTGGAFDCVVAMWLAMGHSAWTLFDSVLSLDGLKDKLAIQLRRNQIVSEKGLEQLTDVFIARILGIGLALLFTFNALEFGSTVYSQFLRDEENIIEREGIGGDVIKEIIYYQVEGQEQTYVLEVSPVRLSEEEFFLEADKVAEDIKGRHFPEGKIISQDIELPLSDERGIFAISWESQTPDILSSRGRVEGKLQKDAKEAVLKMCISYYDYSVTYEIEVLVGERKKSQTELLTEEMAMTLNKLEQEAIEEKELLIPDEICDVKIRLGRNEGKNGRLLGMGVLLAVTTVGVAISRLKETGRKRDGQLLKEYPFFVDSLWLYIEAGMNIKRAICQYVETLDSKESILAGELRYTLNQIDNGEAEYIAYEELGARLSIPVYVSLMRHISQNLKLGTRDLRNLMETEVTIALESKKETAKRLGEEASTKLVFPMIILLVVVMILIMTPAFMNF